MDLNQTSQLDSHPCCHSIKPVNWTAILAVTQSDQYILFFPGGAPPPQTPSRPPAGPKYDISNIKSIFLIFLGRPKAGFPGGLGGRSPPQEKSKKVYWSEAEVPLVSFVNSEPLEQRSGICLAGVNVILRKVQFASITLKALPM